MNQEQHVDDATRAIVTRTRERFERYRRRTVASTDRLFAKLFAGQWLFGILLALTLSPYAWQGKAKAVHLHVWIAVLLGGVIAGLPILLAIARPGETITRHVVAVAQMLYSALLIHLSGGRIETHFHVFGSLAILAFYLDWTVLVTATVVVTLEHFIRGLLWPESVYGVMSPEWWRFLEHFFWVAFAAVFLMLSCRRHIRDWLAAAEEGGMIEALAESEWLNQSVLERESEKPAALGKTHEAIQGE